VSENTQSPPPEPKPPATSPINPPENATPIAPIDPEDYPRLFAHREGDPTPAPPEKPDPFNRTGFDAPRLAQDDMTAELYKSHDLPMAPSMAEVEAKVTQLLGEPKNIITAAELVMGRRVDSEEIMTNLPFLAFPAVNPKEKFGLLLLYKSVTELEQPPQS